MSGGTGAWHSYTQSAMPIYEYRRPNGTTFEVMQRMADEPLTEEGRMAMFERYFPDARLSAEAAGRLARLEHDLHALLESDR